MKYLIIAALLSISVSVHPAQGALPRGPGEKPRIEIGEDIDAALESAKSIYLDFHLDLQNLDRSIDILEGILQKDPNHLEALLFLSRAWLTYGHTKKLDDYEEIRAFKNGFETAERAVDIAPNDADARFLHVANLASWAQSNGVIKSLFLLPRIRGGIEHVLKLDPNHVYGLAMYGMLYYALPGFVGGDLHISEIYLKRALRLDPHLSTAKIHLARTQIKLKKYDEARETLKGLIRDKNPTFYSDWYFNRKVAFKMIEKIEEKEREEKQHDSYTSLTNNN